MSAADDQRTLDQVEAAVRDGASVVAEIAAATQLSTYQTRWALRILVDCEELSARGRGPWRVYAPTPERAAELFAERCDLAGREQRQANLEALERAADPSVAAEFLETRRARWERRLRELGVSAQRAHHLASQLRHSGEWRTVLSTLGEGLVLAGSLAASAVALFLL